MWSLPLQKLIVWSYKFWNRFEVSRLVCFMIWWCISPKLVRDPSDFVHCTRIITSVDKLCSFSLDTSGSGISSNLASITVCSQPVGNYHFWDFQKRNSGLIWTHTDYLVAHKYEVNVFRISLFILEVHVEFYCLHF